LLPALLEGFENSFIVLLNGRSSSPLCLWFRKPLESFKDSDGVFSVVTAGATELIRDKGLLRAGGVFITHMDCLSIFFF
jgi:hypothetical protein